MSLGTHTCCKKHRKRAGLWPCGVNNVFTKGYLFRVNLWCLGSLFQLSFNNKGKFYGLIVPTCRFSKGFLEFSKHIFFPYLQKKWVKFAILFTIKHTNMVTLHRKSPLKWSFTACYRYGHEGWDCRCMCVIMYDCIVYSTNNDVYETARW